MVMLPRLRAERNLEAVRVAQVAGGQFAENSDGQRSAMATLDEWATVADGGDVAAPVKEKQKTAEQRDERRKTFALLGSLGVKVVQHKPKEKTDGKP